MGKGNREIEKIEIRIKDKAKYINVIGIYRRPGKELPMNKQRNLVKKINIKDRWIIAGNFNVHNILWNCRDTDRNGSKLHKAMEEKGMYMVNDRTTT